MSKANTFIFTALIIVAWLIFVGLGIEAGGWIVNFFFSLYRPEFVPNLYQKLDLSYLYERSRWIFFMMYAFILVIAISKTLLFYFVTRLVSGIKLQKPFSGFASRQILLISYYTLFIGFASLIARQSAKALFRKGIVRDNLGAFWDDSQAFILMGAVVYIIAIIFKKGVALQTESDLTV